MSLFLPYTFAVVFDGLPNPARANHPIGRFHNAQEGYDDCWIQNGHLGFLCARAARPVHDEPEFVGALLDEVLRALPWCAETPCPSLRTLAVQRAQVPDEAIEDVRAR
ncbi:uncharacterized protein BXZ73DRAFT_109204 [Epithele typhae]|uniref:uncharacterized protein n=1 Tax=Epithele typhae TaxID=378194 RepID=UPI002008621B|nr:uncharacterized protein BXZ73DRAFT_109204 [Epithele typhae]KAH9910286.1 hypothetical protein BXZ73DRAFT_109204 [Epithele typhae]